MIKMEISVTGVKELAGSIGQMRNVVKDFTPELRDIGRWYIDFVTNDVFETEGGVYGSSWKSLNSKYAVDKAKKYPGRGILERTGFMRTHWKLYTAAQYALIENQADYAIYHQNGTSRIPQRMFMKLDRQRQNQIITMFREGILKRIQNAMK
jgi:phage gpG-like protein